jgi:hypothetical protein
MIEVKLGPLTQAICKDASWEGEDAFPSNQIWADEVERVLSFLQVQGQFERYLPMLRGTLTQRDGALAEARVAFFFHRNGFSILSWEPKGLSNKLGEFEIQWPDTQPIFVEVKGPRWEGELNDAERKGPRRKKPRYINAEARWVDPVERVIYEAGKAAPKFLPNRPNLLVVAGYLLFLSPREIPKNVTEPRIRSALSDKKFSTIGGIMIFDALCKGGPVDYEIVFINNCSAEPLCAIPEIVAKGLLEANRTGFLR